MSINASSWFQILKHGIPPDIFNCRGAVLIITFTALSIHQGARETVDSGAVEAEQGGPTPTPTPTPIGEQERRSAGHDDPLVPPQHGALPARAVGAPGHQRQGCCGVVATCPGAQVLGEAPLGPFDGDHDSRYRLRGFLPCKLEDLEAVLGYGDPHALQELVVEIRHVVFLQLVFNEGEPVFVHQRCLQPCFRHPIEPVHHPTYNVF